jgi:putative endopeptidase
MRVCPIPDIQAPCRFALFTDAIPAENPTRVLHQHAPRSTSERRTHGRDQGQEWLMTSRSWIQCVKCVRLSRTGSVTRPVILFIAAVLSITSVEPPSARETTPDFLASNSDSTVSPREDFYQYANGGWLKRNPLPEGIGTGAREEVYKQIREISETAATTAARPGTAEQLIGTVWATGMDTATINAQGLKPLQRDFDRIDHIRSLADLIDVVALLHRRRMLFDDWFTRPDVLFAGTVQADDTRSHRRIYQLAPGGLSLGPLVYSATDPQRVKVRTALHEYLVKTFLRLGRDSEKARASADAVYNIEAQLARGVPGSLGTSHRLELGELKQAAPTIDWSRYFHGIGVSTTGSFDVRRPEFFSALDAMLRVVPLEDWKDYLRFWLVKLNAPFLDDATYGEFFALKAVSNQRAEPDPRWKRVVWQEKNWFGLPLKKLWSEKYLPKDAVSRYETVGESIRQAFRNRIDRLDWMSDRTRHQAQLKLTKLKIIIGLPKQGVEFNSMQLQPDSYVLNMIRSAEWFHEQEVKMLSGDVAANLALHPEVGGDAEYDVHANEVRIQSPAFPSGLRRDELDDAFVYGSTPLGHEISHAFDSEGRHYDASGNKVDWWTPEDAAAFDTRAAALIDEYSQFTTRGGVHLDGKSALAENMADLVGLRVKLDAFMKTPQFTRNKLVGGFTPLQRFFLAYAYANIGRQRTEAPGGRYAPDRYRVNGVVMNVPEFYEAFGVEPGDPMYRPESARVTIW